MALVFADRVKETSTTTGTGTYSLAGAATGFRTFVAGIATGNTCHYCAEDGTDWEVGVGTVTDATPDTLSRDSILASSNGGSAVNWTAGTRNLFCVNAAADVYQATTQAQQESASANTVFVTPGTQHHHPTAVKGWVNFDGTGTPSIKASRNVASITDNGTGNYTVVWDTDFSSATYGVVVSAGVSGTRVLTDLLGSGSQATTGSQVFCFGTTGLGVDPTVVCMLACGDQ